MSRLKARRRLALAMSAAVIAGACGPTPEGPDPAREDPQAPEDAEADAETR